MVLWTTILDSVAIILCCAYLLTFFVFCLGLIAFGSLSGIVGVVCFYKMQVEIAALPQLTAEQAICIDRELTKNCTEQKQLLETTYA